MADDPTKKFELVAEQVTSQQRLPLKPPADAPARPAFRRKDTARLVWDSKPKRPPSPRDIEFQTAEIVIPNPARDAGTLPFTHRDDILQNQEIDRSKMNRLIWGDNLLAMQALLAQGYEGKIDLIYIDPPFDSKADYSHRMEVGDQHVTKEPSILERLAYRDTWEAGTDSYLDMLYPRLQLMRRLLAEHGSIYVHIEPGISSYVKILCDEAFGPHAFQNEIVWKRAAPRAHAYSRYPSTHDIVLLYAKSSKARWNPQHITYDQDYIDKYYRYVEPESGRRYCLDNLINPNPDRPTLTYEWGGVTKVWRYARDRMKELHDEGRIHYPDDGGVPRYKRYLDEMQGVPVTSIWSDIAPVNSQAREDTGYDTQKPSQLLERIVTTSSDLGDLVADFFAGSGTAASVAERLGRRWIATDLGKVGIQVTRARLVQQDAKPFLIENIGNYQREMIYLTGGRIGEMQRIILKLYGATPHPAYKDLGTRKADDGAIELVYVGYPDRPTTAKKVEELARQAETLDGSGYKRLVILAWDYDYNFDAEWEHRLKAAKRPPTCEIQRRMIPPDVYDYLKKAKDEADIEKLASKIQFHEKPYLKLARARTAKAEGGKRELTIAIERYVLFDLPVPEREREKLREAIKDNFAILIDYWAVDWDYDGNTFRSQWQALRGNGKRAKVVATEASAIVEPKKSRTVAVRVVDVFGNDATGILRVE